MAVLNVDGTMPLFKDSFIICKSGGPSAGINSLNRLVGMGSSKQVVGFEVETNSFNVSQVISLNFDKVMLDGRVGDVGDVG